MCSSNLVDVPEPSLNVRGCTAEYGAVVAQLDTHGGARSYIDSFQDGDHQAEPTAVYLPSCQQTPYQ
ncbi:hypothetical protein ABIA33_003639 [Streptacidiphilus sp. MAP12-16]